ncbi:MULTISPECIES: MFS transporter [unclassified Kitasatospora]|uniref:MFS transporter n=1 Tax=unclassified Kitasatospora TaxID=2633591 RepID=UPI00070F11BB|nr:MULTISPECIES: MFS transporter [unclassified Kitasatospora]KQV17582.1 MFS transporter [Kitasatospora sp. Root107]KRB69307.1 MFS transporter [Kitasatospora sp. Root187]
MTATQIRGAATGTGDRSRPRGVLPALCATQIIGWGILYYAFPVLLPHITAATGWSSARTTAAFSAALLVSALVGIPIGRVLDRHGPHVVMTTGSVLGVAALVGIALAPNLAIFSAAWLLAGAAMSASFYHPAFAALTRWHQPDHVRALTTVTLAGGLASTVFAPVTAQLADHLSWRTTYLVLAAVLATTALPLHALTLRHPWPEATPPGTTVNSAVPARSRPFVLLAAAFTLSSFAMYGVVFTLVPLLLARGVSVTTAAWALGLGGLGQTFGRTLYAALARRTDVTRRTAALFAAGGLTTAVLAVTPGPPPLLFAAAILAGVVRGNLTLLQATAVTDRWGTTSYGRLSGLLAAPASTAGALAPWAAAALVPVLGGHPQLLLLLAGLSLAAACLALSAARSSASTARRPPLAPR